MNVDPFCICCRSSISEDGHCNNCGLLNRNIAEADKEYILLNRLAVIPPEMFVNSSLPAIYNGMQDLKKRFHSREESYLIYIFCFCFYLYLISSHGNFKKGKEDVICEELKQFYFEASNVFIEDMDNSILNNERNKFLNLIYMEKLFTFLRRSIVKDQSIISQALELSGFLFEKEDLSKGLLLTFFCRSRLANATECFGKFFLTENKDFNKV